jgi:Concanavalin A-like lectin/glucanases superfamily
VSGGGGGGSPAPAPAPTPPPAPAPYIAEAVHFDGNSNLTNLNNPTLWANGFTYSGWVKLDDPDFVTSFATIFQTLNAFFGDPGYGIGEGTVISIPFTFPSDLGVGFEEANSPDATGGAFGGSSADGLMSVGAWHHIFISADSNQEVGSRLLKIYLDGVSVLDPTNSYDDPLGQPDFTTIRHGPIITIPGATLAQNSNGQYLSAMDVSDVQVWLDQYIDPTPENLAKFISDGKPVDPAVAEATFGQPSILFSGDSSNFVTNQGTDGPFTLIGTLTNSDTSPSN